MDTVDWTPEAGYPPSSSPDTLPWRPRGSGTHLGLTIVLDAELQQFHCSTSASVGFKVRATAYTGHLHEFFHVISTVILSFFSTRQRNLLDNWRQFSDIQHNAFKIHTVQLYRPSQS